MSVRQLTRVWERSKHRGSELLIMLAIADFADDDGRAYPAVPTLARKCRMTARNANLLLARLRASGELEIAAGRGVRGTNAYRITIGEEPLKPASPPTPEAAFRVKSASGMKPASRTPEAGFPKPLKPASDKPSLNRHEPERGGDKRPRTPRASRLPSDWKLPEDWAGYCREKRPDLDPVAVAEDFADFWRAKAGPDALKLDWRATWQRWVRNQHAHSSGPATQRRSALHADDVLGAD